MVGVARVAQHSCSIFFVDLLRAGASVRQSIVFNLHGAFSRGSSGGPKSPLLVRVSCNCGLPGIDAIFELAFASDRALRRGSSGGPIFALNPGGSWVDAEMSLGKDPYLDRASGPESRGRHRILCLLAPFYGPSLHFRDLGRRSGISSTINFRDGVAKGRLRIMGFSG